MSFSRFVLWCGLFFSFSAVAQNLSADEIIAKQKQLNENHNDETVTAQMILKYSSGKVATRELIIKYLKSTKDRRSLLRFLSPADVMGMGLLSTQEMGKTAQQWLYLPALKRVKRLIGASQGGSFAGSNFSYEDFVPFHNDNFIHTRVPQNDTAEFYSLVARVKNPKESGYAKKHLKISKQNFQTVEIEFFNHKDQKIKTAVFEDFKKIDDKFWRAHRVMMQDDKQTSQIIFKNFSINKGLDESAFSERALQN